ncbi:MAG TPA: DUF2520 domain-containing protein [Candidatus Humimicrobiaceae bacterium]
MKKIKSIDLCVIGAGRVGVTVCYTFTLKNLSGIKVKAISSRSAESLKKAKRFLGVRAADIIFTGDNTKAAALANCVLICTPDDSIKAVCDNIFKNKKNNYLKDYYVFHFSGSKSLEVLDSARAAGAEIASIHPLKSFASVGEAIKSLPGTVFGITYSSIKSKKVAEFMVKNLGGETIEVENENKPLYHAAACVASNYLVTLMDYAVSIHKRIGIKPEDSLKGLISLAEGTVNNIKKMGTKKSLTGPIARGDTGTIREHMVSFRKFFPKDYSDLYKTMGIETSKIAYQNKWIDKNAAEELKKILKD